MGMKLYFINRRVFPMVVDSTKKDRKSMLNNSIKIECINFFADFILVAYEKVKILIMNICI